MVYHFSSWLTATLNLCLIYFKITWVLATLLEHMHKKFEINRTKNKGGCQSGRKVLTHNSKSDLPPEIVKWNLKKTYLWLQWNILFKLGNRGLYDLQCRYFHLLLHLSVVHLWSLENWSRSSLVCKYVCIFSLNKKNVAWGTIGSAQRNIFTGYILLIYGVKLNS